MRTDPSGFATAWDFKPGGVAVSEDIRARGVSAVWKRGGRASARFTLKGRTTLRVAVGLPEGGALALDGAVVHTAQRDERVPDAHLSAPQTLTAGVHEVVVTLPKVGGRWPGPGFFVRLVDDSGAPVPVRWEVRGRLEPKAFVTADVGLKLSASAGTPPSWRAEVRVATSIPERLAGREVPVCVQAGPGWPKTQVLCAATPQNRCTFEVPWTGPGKGAMRAHVAVGDRCRDRVQSSPVVRREDIVHAMELQGALKGRPDAYDGVRFLLQALEDLTQTDPAYPRPARYSMTDLRRALKRAHDDLDRAAVWEPGPNLRAYRSALDGRYQPYVVVLPESARNDPSKKRPPRSLVVGLHGYGGAPWSMCRAMVPRVRDLPSDMIAVCPYGYGDLAFRYAGRRDLFEVVRRVQSAHGIDPARVHLVGVSDGGLAAFEVGLDHPRHFASVAALAAGGDMRAYKSIGRAGHKPWESRWLDAVSPVARASRGSAQVQWLVVYGGRDRFPESARRMAAALRESGAQVELREIREAGHDVWTETFAEGALFDRLRPIRKKMQKGVARRNSEPHMTAEGGTVGCTPGPEALDRLRDLSLLHVFGTGDPAQTALYRYLAELDSERWGRRVHLSRGVMSDESLTLDHKSYSGRSLVLVGTPRDHSAIRRLAPDAGELLAEVLGDVGLRDLRRPEGRASGCPRVLVLATGTTPRGVALGSHLPEILPKRVWTGAHGVLPPFGQVLGKERTFIRTQ